MSKHITGNSRHLRFFLFNTNYIIIYFVHTSVVTFLEHLTNMSVMASSLGQTESLASSSSCIFLVCLGPPSILLFVPMIHVSHMHPPLPTGQLNTSTQVNNMAMLHLIYNVTHIYITKILLFILFLMLIPHHWAGRLVPIPFVTTVSSICTMYLI